MEFSLNQMIVNKSPKSTICTEKGPLLTGECLTWVLGTVGCFLMSDPRVLVEE